MKTLLAWLLLAVIPCSSLRIICITPPSTPDAAAARTGDGLDCVTMCSKQAHARPPRTRCVLVDDPSCAFALGSPIAIVPVVPAFAFARTVQPFDAIEYASYRIPALDHASPPPKA
jgi:hypothetical protein